MKNTIIALTLITLPLAGLKATDFCKDQLADLLMKSELAKSRRDSAAVSRLNTARDKPRTYCSDDRQARRSSYAVSQRKIKLKRAGLELQKARQEQMQSVVPTKASWVEEMQS